MMPKRSLFRSTPQRKLKNASFNDVNTPDGPELCSPKSSSDEEEYIDETGPVVMEDNQGEVRHFAVTVNIQPTKYMNKKLWRTYTQEQQRAQLLRIESAFRRKTPSVKLHELCFEVCPTLQQIHYHAHYEMPKEFEHEMYNYFKRICCSQDDKTLKPWRFIDISILPTDADVKRWMDYIHKNQTKTH